MNYFIAGLGNPGSQYVRTRHNLGREIVEEFHKKTGFGEWHLHSKAKVKISQGEISGKSVTLILPETFMNVSGAELKKYISVLNENSCFVVVQDDLDLPFGAIKISYDRNSGGHNGVESVINSFGTKEFVRLRAGILPLGQNGEIAKPQREDISNYVLQKFSQDENTKIPEIHSKSIEILEKIISDGYTSAMNMYN